MKYIEITISLDKNINHQYPKVTPIKNIYSESGNIAFPIGCKLHYTVKQAFGESAYRQTYCGDISEITLCFDLRVPTCDPICDPTGFEGVKMTEQEFIKSIQINIDESYNLGLT